MALINCPECGKEISDKVKACPHCGYPFDEKSENIPQQVEVTSVKLTNKKVNKKVLISAMLVIVIGVICTIVVQMSNAAKMKEERSTYIDNLNTVKMLMLSGASEAETLCNLTGSVWKNTIYNDSDSETNKYCIREDKYEESKIYYGKYDFESDFNTAIAKLFKDTSTQSTVDSIKEGQTRVQDLMKELNNPTEEFSKIYDTISELYSSYQGLTDLAINPTGSLTSFLQSKSDKVDKFMEYYNKLETQMPSEE